MRWIVTGCNGYVGGELCKHLVGEGLDVVGVHRPGRGREDLASIRQVTYDELPHALGGGDVVIHCAACTELSAPWEAYVRSNMELSAELYQMARACRAQAFVYLSSVAALGYGGRDGEVSFTEDEPPVHQSFELYGRSKWLAEERLRQMSIGSALPLTIARLGIVYGRNPSRRPSWWRRGVRLNGRERLPLVHHRNVCDAVVALVRRQVEGTYFVVDEEQPWRCDVDALKEKLGISRPPWPLGAGMLRLQLSLAPRFGSSCRDNLSRLALMQYMSNRRILYSTVRLREATGWYPQVDLFNGLGASGHPGLALRTPRRIGVWTKPGTTERELLTRVARVDPTRPVHVVARTTSREEFLQIHRRHHAHSWLIDAEVDTLSNVTWGCRDIVVVGNRLPPPRPGVVFRHLPKVK